MATANLTTNSVSAPAHVDFEVLANRAQRVCMSGLRKGKLVEILKLREDAGLLLSFLEWLKGTDDESRRAIEDLKTEIIRLLVEIQRVRINGIIPDALGLPGESLSVGFERVVDKLRWVGYLLFPEGILFVESLLFPAVRANEPMLVM